MNHLGKICGKHPELMGERSSVSRNCVECRREYMKAYMAGLREDKAYVKKQGIKSREKANSKIVSGGSDRYTGKICDKHPELEGERMLKNRQCRECFLESKRRWAKTGRNRNKAMSMAYSRIRRFLSINQMPKWADRKEIQKIYDSRKPGEHVDHVIPLKGICPITKEHIVCGLHVENNLKVVNGSENDHKWAWFNVIMEVVK